MAKVEGGFPHSEIQGSKPVRGSPRLIAAYHVLHRLSAPRHPPDTLMTLDHSHHRCPLGEPEGSLPIKRTSTLGTAKRRRQIHPAGGPKTFASEHVRGGGRSSSPSPSPALRDPSHDGKAAGLHRPVGSGRFGKLRLPRGQTLGSDTFTLHDVEQLARPRASGAQPQRRAMRQPARPVANSYGADGLDEPWGWDVVRSTIPLTPPPGAMVEQDGIEPTTSCLQSTRSPN
jgi:hypothetical protein